jgi:formate-dependent nitrite reductase membrane component NrfD
MDHEHFAVSPDWRWWILFYFFLAGIAGGAYVIGALLRFTGGRARDRGAERVAFLVSFPVVAICPILLILDLGSPGRFWHMLINTTPGQHGLNFITGSPMSVGVWGLSLFALLSFVTFVATLSQTRSGTGGAARLMEGAPGSLIVVAGAVLGLFVASYTGVLLSVSNQSVWSDTWTLGGLFVASGLSAAGVVVAVAARRRGSASTERSLAAADGWFAVVELIFVVLFFITVGAAGTASTVLGHGWVLLWVVVGIGLLVSLLGLLRRVPAGATAAVAPVLVVLGVFALRAVIIFSPQ